MTQLWGWSTSLTQQRRAWHLKSKSNGDYLIFYKWKLVYRLIEETAICFIEISTKWTSFLFNPLNILIYEMNKYFGSVPWKKSWNKWKNKTIHLKFMNWFCCYTSTCRYISLNTDKQFSFHYRIEYFDDMAKEEGSPVDDSSRTTWEPAAIAHKNLLIDGMQILCDEFSRPTHQTPSRMFSSDSYQQVWSTMVMYLMLDVYI